MCRGVRYWDDEYRGHVQYYDRHRLEFRRDAAQAWKKLIELGCEGMLQASTVSLSCHMGTNIQLEYISIVLSGKLT